MNNKLFREIVAYTLNEFIGTGQTVKAEKKFSNRIQDKKACFVTLKKDNKELRGCIGTLKPTYKNLSLEIIRNTVSAASRDYRFAPVTLSELDKLTFSIEILDTPERISQTSALDPHKFGLILEDRITKQRGVLLPNISGIETIDEQIKIVKKKAGIKNKSIDELNMWRFTTQKY
ncbi:MAG: AmmeMemoRadiSam system protein A [Bacteroidota bacterium]|nr:AmmeMemoRadiSam system protein A [Bacteroidota bacterium]